MTGLKHLLLLLLALTAGLSSLTSCDEDLGEDTEYADWQNRNHAFFLDKFSEAKAAVAQAKATYGDNWQEHCRWRVFRTFALTEEAAATATDSICVEVLHNGGGSGCPFYTDSVRVNYLERLIPSESYPEGKVFDHSGQYAEAEQVFNPDFAIPRTFLTSNVVEGFSTALQEMHINDLWRIYIPQNMAYGAQALNSVPAYSTLIFDVQLKSYYRAGVTPDPWQ